MKNIKSIVYNAIKPYSALLFLNNKYAGLLLLAITFLNPAVAISGMIAVFFTILFAEFLEFKEAYLTQGFYVYNSLLVGLGIGYIFYPSLISIALIAILSAFTFMLSFMLNRLFSVYMIPILSLPFSIVTLFAYLASLKYSNLLSTMVNTQAITDITLPLILSSFLKSLGTIFFLPTNIAGILIVLLILYFSRIIFFMAVTGFYFGVFVHSFFIGSFTEALSDAYAFNYILVAIALCGIFLLPTLKNFFVALIGVAISVVLTDAIGILFQYYSIPVFTLPFNITVIIFIFILSMIYYKEFNIDIKDTPEASLSNYLSKIFRYGEIGPKIGLPFSGEWSVYQAFDGEWTHKGKYQYAYDFVKKIRGSSYKNEGLYKEEYYAFGESVLSPVNGYVVDLRSDLADNAIGEVDRINNWGNYIIIKSDLGFYVEISHLMQYSTLVSVGAYVQENSILAKCGNSGYSPEPHIHIQVQDIGVVGGFTKKFSFNEYIQRERLIINALPKQDETLSSVIVDKGLKSRFLFILDDTFSYEVYKDSKKIEKIEFIVKMTESGEFYLKDRDDNRLFFYTDTKEFYFYNYIGNDSYLKYFFILSPRIHFVRSSVLYYVDYLPLYLLKSKFQRIMTELMSSVKKDIYKQECRYKFDGNSIESKYGVVSLDVNKKGIVNLKYKNIELKAC